MIKLVYCVHRKAGMSPEEFYRYWKDNHGPLVQSFAEVLKAQRYVQSHLLESPLNEIAQGGRGASGAFDGITEIWWNSHEELVGAMQTPEGAAAHEKLIEDEATFCDLSRSSIFLTEEHTIFDSQ
ncbi:MAG: hypothetical protein CMN05_10440 [Roseibacillus sp.]|nr:hypothetical protein [Roseibacillus sp.]MBP34771.1 hypothetical protein [Roseibacillus sp.]MCP4729765.1 EthD domain-containing protein [Roseibacillus sp.]MDP6206982.1 EthD domain-containing protein [Roseibacillus sp.]MDP7105545.1 EthD domain-containing protein [Roseibacillus sp.]